MMLLNASPVLQGKHQCQRIQGDLKYKTSTVRTASRLPCNGAMLTLVVDFFKSGMATFRRPKEQFLPGGALMSRIRRVSPHDRAHGEGKD